MAPKSAWLEPKMLVPSGVAIVAVVALIVVLAFGGSTGDSVGSASSVSSTTTAPAASTSAAPGTDPVAGSGSPAPTTVVPGPYTTPTMPVAIEAPPVTGAVDGESVTVHAGPESGSRLYGVEARLCRGDAAIVDDGMFTPTLGGVCIDKPLSAISDMKVSVIGVEPFTGLDITFRVGVGTTRFATQYSGTSSITCGPDSPCQIVLKLQYPAGFGFKGIPVTYR